MALKVEDVFDSRRYDVNDKIYIHRPFLENTLKEALKGSKHIVIHGESGCGKSWLYKKVFKEVKIQYKVADCANAAESTLRGEFTRLADALEPIVKEGFNETKSATAKVLVAEGTLEHEAQYKIVQKEPFERLLYLLNRLAGNKRSVLVIDNLEKIIDDKARIKELGNIITLCDNEDYAKYNVKLLVVGVPRELRAYFMKTPNQDTVANRLQELPEVRGLDADGTHKFVYIGFVGLLGFRLDPIELRKWGSEIHNLTMGIPQGLHDLCQKIASLYLRAQELKLERKNIIASGAKRWVTDTMSKHRTHIESAMNNRLTTEGRRNQILYALGRITSETFTVTQVERQVRSEFPLSTRNRALGVSATLTKLATLENPVIASNGRGGGYVFKDKRYKMCLKAILRVDGEAVKIAPEEPELPPVPAPI